MAFEEAGYFTGEGTFTFDPKFQKLRKKGKHDHMGAALITALNDVQLPQVYSNF